MGTTRAPSARGRSRHRRAGRASPVSWRGSRADRAAGSQRGGRGKRTPTGIGSYCTMLHADRKIARDGVPWSGHAIHRGGHGKDDGHNRAHGRTRGVRMPAGAFPPPGVPDRLGRSGMASAAAGDHRPRRPSPRRRLRHRPWQLRVEEAGCKRAPGRRLQGRARCPGSSSRQQQQCGWSRSGGV